MNEIYNFFEENAVLMVGVLFALIVLGGSQLRNTDDEDHYNNLNS
jgi:hypothetical protein